VSPLTAAVVALAIFTVLLAAGSAGLYRRVRELELAVYNGVGANLGGGPGQSAGSALRSLISPGRTSIIIKINRQCPVCDELMAGVRTIAPRLDNDLQLVVLSDDPTFDRLFPENVRVIKDPDAWRAAAVPYVPALLVVDERGTVVNTMPGGSVEALEEVVTQVANSRKGTAI